MWIRVIKILFLFSVALSVGFFLYQTDFRESYALIRRVGWNALLLVVISGSSYWIATWAWMLCMETKPTSLQLYRLFMIRLVAENLAVFNPTSVIGGDAYKVIALRKEGLSDAVATASVMLSRAIMVASQVFILMISGLLFFRNFLPALLMFSTVLGVLLLFIFYFIKNKKIRNLNKLPTWLIPAFQSVRDGLVLLRMQLKAQRSAILTAFLLTLLNWLVGSLEFYLLLRLFGYPVNPWHAVHVDSGVQLFKSLGAFIPGQVGVEEFGNRFMLQQIGIAGGSIWLVVSVFRRARQLFWLLIATGAYFFIHERTLYQSQIPAGYRRNGEAKF